MKGKWTYLLVLLLLASCAGQQSPESSEQKSVPEYDVNQPEKSTDTTMIISVPDGNGLASPAYGYFKHLQADTLTVEELELFEERAAQKIHDYFEYIAIISDPTMDKSFRQQAIRMARTLQPDGLIVMDTISKLTGDQSDRLELRSKKFLNKLGKDRFGKLIFSVENLLSQPFQRHDEGGYLTEIIIDLVNGKDTISVAVHCQVQKTTKQFGSEERQVWEVSLGSIVPANAEGLP